MSSAEQSFGKDGFAVVSGGCHLGPDAFAADEARSRGVELIEYPVPNIAGMDRKLFRRLAYSRNEDVARGSDVLFALVHEDRTGGTENTVGHSLNHGKKTYLVDGAGKCSDISAAPREQGREKS